MIFPAFLAFFRSLQKYDFSSFTMQAARWEIRLGFAFVSLLEITTYS